MSSGPDDDFSVTHDTLLRGRVKLIQPAHGYRSSLDPLLLATFLAPPYGRVLDVGCGAGALAFLLLARDLQATAVGVEIQPRLARLAARGAEENGFGPRFAVRAGDVRGLEGLGRFDLVAVNPPFRSLGTGVLPRDEERSVANHEVFLTLAEWLDAALDHLAPAGRLGVVFPASRWDELQASLATRRLGASRVRPVVSRAGEPPSRVLVEASRAPVAQAIALATLVVHEQGGFSPEVRAIVGEPAL